MQTEEHTIATSTGPLRLLIAKPATGVAAGGPFVLVLALDAKTMLNDRPYCITAEAIVAAGGVAVSFDLPHHGRRVGADGQGIHGFAKVWAGGRDAFEQVIIDAGATIDFAIETGLATLGRIAVVGVSRGGYCAMRIAAADARVDAGVGVALVTDWRELTEFAPYKEDDRLSELRLEHYATSLAGRSLWLVIPAADRRVGTPACIRFVHALFAEEERLGLEASRIEFSVDTKSQGHRAGDKQHDAAAAWLYEQFALQPSQTHAK